LVQGFYREGTVGIIFNWQSNKRPLIPQDVTVDNRRYEDKHNQLLEANLSVIP
jgi:hypothetical protein